MFIERDLESKRSLRTLRAPAYILAHKAVVTDLSALIDSNIAFLSERARRCSTA